MARIHGLPVVHARKPYGELLVANLIRSTACGIFGICPCLLATDWCASEAIDLGSTVYKSTINTGSASGGSVDMPTKSRLQTTTRHKEQRSCRQSGRKLPTHRPPTHPGEMLFEEFLRPLDITQTAFAARLGVSYPRLNEIVRGKRGVTPDTALRLERVLGMSAEFWLGLQQDWDLWYAKHSDRATEIAGLEPLRY